MAEGGEKTLNPSAKKIAKARERGHVPRSRELAPALSFLAVASATTMVGGLPWTRPFGELGPAIAGATHLEMSPDAAWLLLVASLRSWAPAAIALFGAAAGGSFLALAFHGGPQPSAEALHIDPSKLSPVGRLKSLFSLTHLWDHGRALVAAAVSGWIVYKAILELVPNLGSLYAMRPVAVAARLGHVLLTIAWRMGLALVVLGAFDLFMSHLLYKRSLKMSRQELKDEAKEDEGSPEVRVRRRRRLSEMLRGRSIAGVKRADVVVTNPTHYAVALSYKRAAMSAPRVVAKGRNRMAHKIRVEAVKHGVPIVENPPLARELYRKVEVDREIPAELFLAVAEVIAFVMRLRGAIDAHVPPATAHVAATEQP